MKFLHRLFKDIIAIAMFVVSVTLIIACSSEGLWNDFVMVFGDARFYLLFFGIALFFCNILYVLSGMNIEKSDECISIEGENGVITISAQAIKNYIVKLSSEFPSIVKLQPKIISKKRYIDIIVLVRVKPDPQIHEACGVLQKRIRETLASALGILEVRKIEINIREISGRYTDLI
jgi:competence protein ComGC